MNDRYRRKSRDFSRVEQIVAFLADNYKSQPSLGEIAAFAKLSKFHLQRTFKKLVGISPTQLLQLITLEHAKGLLSLSSSVLEASFELGLSGPSRLHDLFVSFEGITPGEFKRNCAGLSIKYASFNSPLGYCQIAASARGICHQAFTKGKNNTKFVELLASKYTKADFSHNLQDIEKYQNKLFPSSLSTELGQCCLLIKGTNLQINFWKALLTMASDSEEGLQQSSTVEKNANNRKPKQNSEIVDFLIPCHRIVREFVCEVTNRTRTFQNREAVIR